MASDVERNVNMLFKTADLQIKTVTTVMSVVKDLFEYLSKDNDVRIGLKCRLRKYVCRMDAVRYFSEEDGPYGIVLSIGRNP